jgi:hypothetical protein
MLLNFMGVNPYKLYKFIEKWDSSSWDIVIAIALIALISASIVYLTNSKKMRDLRDLDESDPEWDEKSDHIIDRLIIKKPLYISFLGSIGVVFGFIYLFQETFDNLDVEIAGHAGIITAINLFIPITLILVPIVVTKWMGWMRRKEGEGKYSVRLVLICAGIVATVYIVNAIIPTPDRWIQVIDLLLGSME